MRSGLLEALVIGTCVVLVMALVRATVLQLYWIPSASMEPLLDLGDRIAVAKYDASTYRRGEVVVFRAPASWEAHRPPVATDDNLLEQVLTLVGLRPEDSEHFVVKRIIGLGGDRVACCDIAGQLTVNSVAVDEPYLAAGNQPSNESFDTTVPNGMVWMMGDHRAVSADSRRSGPVPLENLIGPVVARVWPWNRFTTRVP